MLGKWALVLLGVCARCQDPNSLVLCPKTLAVGQVCQCFYSQFGSTPAPVSLQLFDALSALKATAIRSDTSPNIYNLAVPSDATPGVYTLRASDGGWQSSVDVTTGSAVLLMESDKALYKPGQTARFRVLALSSGHLIPLAAQPISFTVTSPDGFKLLRLSSPTDNFGVAKFDFPIATEPLMGAHIASASVDGGGQGIGAAQMLTFTIEEYVLPRFEVQLQLDQSLLPVVRSADAVTLTGKVSANFTFGEAVTGTATIHVFSPTNGAYAMSRVGAVRGGVVAGGFAPNAVDAMPTKETASSSLPPSTHQEVAFALGLLVNGGNPTPFEVKVPTASLQVGSNLVVEASVVSSATGERQNTTETVFVAYSGSEVKVSLALSDGQTSFKPGLPLAVKAMFSKPDGTTPTSAETSAAALELVVEPQTVSYMQASSQQTLRLQLRTDASGVASVTIPPFLEASKCCNPLANRTTSEEYQTLCGCCIASLNLRVEATYPGQDYPSYVSGPDNSPSKSAMCLSRAYSPTGAYMSVIDVKSVDAINGVYGVKSVYSVDPALLSTSAEYILLRAGAVVGGGTMQLASGVQTTTPYRELDGTLTLPAGLSGDLNLVITVAYKDTSAKRPFLAASYKFSVKLQMPFTLSASFAQLEVKPREAVSIELTARDNVGDFSSASIQAFVTSLDRSAELLGKRSAISESAILQALQSAATGASEVEVDAQPWKQCNAQGMMVLGELPATIKAVAGIGHRIDDSDFDISYGEAIYSCPRPLENACSMFFGGGIMVKEMAPNVKMAASAPSAGGAAESNAELRTGADQNAVGANAATVTVRSFFPETWLWDDLAMVSQPDGSFVASFNSVAPDTITTWSLEVFATSSLGIAAVRAETPLRVFQPFFVEMRLPYAAIRGEEVDIIVSVFNYLAGSGTLTAQLVVTLPAELEPVGGAAALSQKLSIQENAATMVTIRVKPTKLGTFTINAASTSTAQSTSVGDAIEKTLMVKPEGVEVVSVKNIVLDLSKVHTFSDSLLLDFFADIVDGSDKLSVYVVGDLLGPTLSGLDRLIQIPSGCGEQNMITLAPNVYVGKYLLAVGKLTPDFQQRIVKNMIVGYGRELTYRHPDGSFSAFGTSDDSGSTWLTAFVLRVFAEVQGSGLVAVDTSVLQSAANFLVSTQEASGAFKSLGNVIHTEMTGGADGGGISLSAYVLSALAQAKAEVPAAFGSSLDGALSKGKSYILSQKPTTAYETLLRAHALGLAGPWTPSQVAAEALSISHVEGDKRWWDTSDDVTTTSAPSSSGRLALGGQGMGPGQSKAVELTGYGVLALTQAGNIAEAFSAVRWLLEKRNAQGGFMSTQDTVVGLNALATYAEAAMSNVDMNITVTDGASFNQALTVNGANVDVLQSMSLPKPGHVVNISASGTGIALVVGELRYNIPEVSVDQCYDVEVEWFGQQGGSICAVKACALIREGCLPIKVGGMAMLSVGLFTGYEAITPSLDDLKKRRSSVKRWEISEGKVDLYVVMESPTDTFCAEFQVSKVYDVYNLQPRLSAVTDYYSPEIEGRTLSKYAITQTSSPINEGGFEEVVQKTTLGAITETTLTPVNPTSSSATTSFACSALSASSLAFALWLGATSF